MWPYCTDTAWTTSVRTQSTDCRPHRLQPINCPEINISVAQLGPVKALNGIELLLLGGAGVLRSGMFRCFWVKKGMLCFCFCQFISNHCVCRNPTTLQIGSAHQCTVRCQICCLSRASGVIAVVSGPSMVSVVFRLVRSWLICNSGFWLRLFVARFWLADVG